MTPSLQRWLALALVALAALYLVRRAWHSWRASSAARRSGGCDPGCGCG